MRVAYHIERCVPGQSTLGVLPGDFVLTRGHGWTSWLIRVGERLRYRGKDRKFAYWNHTALFVSTNGDIIEALGSGVTKRNISLYKPIDYHVVHLDGVSNDVRQNEVVFAEHCLQSEPKVRLSDNREHRAATPRLSALGRHRQRLFHRAASLEVDRRAARGRWNFRPVPRGVRA